MKWLTLSRAKHVQRLSVQLEQRRETRVAQETQVQAGRQQAEHTRVDLQEGRHLERFGLLLFRPMLQSCRQYVVQDSYSCKCRIMIDKIDNILDV